MFLMFRDTILEVVSLAEYLETDRLCKWQNRKLEVVMGKNTGDGMDLILMWNGVPALSVGVEQAGLIESGAMPKFSLCENGIDWFKSHGKWQETGGIPSAGSLVFFDWNGDGISDHVGIVEKYEGGIIYTVEGNTGTNIGGNNVRGVWKHSYSVGSATILGYGII